ncbi:hypothetical protein [Chitinophaga sp. CF418]|uniref:hypothetical protein n=1 Tax=Chitinophaga sp. CF418 TaxID=1855287 RepID=UPI000914DED5|nr:hypothetical protein [Chitinophaga sp. CF418]SHN45446.1 hypothetical protein SAMN05216311_12054 [Chitinophaga sp. CF418]
MKKIKLALIALFSVIGVGSIAATSHAPGDYYFTPTDTTPIPGVKGVDWTCLDIPEFTCAYLELPNHSRLRIEGVYTEIEP